MIRATGCIQQIQAFTLIALLTGLTVPAHASFEQLDYALMLRQLDAIDHLTSQLAARPHAEQDRYHFNYDRLRADIRRVRTGVQDFLTPERAQPRDPVSLHGDYRDEVVLAP
jgi:RAQPRD family integrative conjugative element protein